MEHARSRIHWLAGAVLALVLLPSAGSAQQRADSRWLPWLGCWEGTEATASDMYVCVRPATNGIEVATVADNEIASTRTIIADGQRHEFSEEGCTGWQTADFSKDGRRVFLRSERTCEGGVRRTASAIMGMTSSYEWLDAQSIGMGDERMPRAIRYRLAPSDVARNLGFSLPADRQMAASEARTMATMDLSLSDVGEAADHVDSEALEAFLIERNQPFDVDAKQIVAMADDGVPSDVIDVVVAVSNPNHFRIDREGMRMAEVPQERDRAARDRYGYDPFGWGYYGNSYRRCSAYTFYDSFYCDRYAYGLGGGYGYGYYDPYWYGYSGRPVIIVNPGTDNPDVTPGRVVRGRGYTRGGAPSGGSRSAGSGSKAGPPPASSGSSGSSGATKATTGGYMKSSGSSGASSSSGATRTAKKKTGGGGH
jgi:hypothetical protein